MPHGFLHPVMSGLTHSPVTARNEDYSYLLVKGLVISGIKSGDFREVRTDSRKLADQKNVARRWKNAESAGLEEEARLGKGTWSIHHQGYSSLK